MNRRGFRKIINVILAVAVVGSWISLFVSASGTLMQNGINGIGEWPDTNDWYLFLTWGYPVGVIIFSVICVVTWLLGLAMRKLHRTV